MVMMMISVHGDDYNENCSNDDDGYDVTVRMLIMMVLEMAAVTSMVVMIW